MGEEPLSIIALAVTPAVMISATAILISGVSAKHSSMADRMRALMTEYREPNLPGDRRRNIEAQSRLFQRRLRLIANAHLALYVATAFFVAMVFAIGVSSSIPVTRAVLYPLFLVGIAILGCGVVFEVMELRLADRTLQLEIGDSLAGKDKTTSR